MSQALNINTILSTFGNSSGHRVSKNKTQIYFSATVSDSLKSEINTTLGFKIVNSLVRKGSCTSLWRAIANSWDFLRDNLAWSLVNGESENFLHDVWIPSLGPLRNHLLDHVSPSFNISFAEVITDEGNWNLGKLSLFFTQAAILHIAGTKCAGFQDVSDQCFWKHDKKHIFSTKSTYAQLSESTWDASHSTWKNIWNLHVPQRLRLFTWLTYRQWLMTNLEIYRCSIGNNLLCLIFMSWMNPFCTLCVTAGLASQQYVMIAQRYVALSRLFGPSPIWYGDIG
ncbi:hypothetical protein V6N11_039630 [Hibiscus sabdariffa]|uniref:Reverse transcriptase zinc-binding domain-containing protein n=1 Tax=Hibiscus sabdariffa TaxID=183260 RepID=A0ABR2SP70_9ROSI